LITKDNEWRRVWGTSPNRYNNWRWWHIRWRSNSMSTWNKSIVCGHQCFDNTILWKWRSMLYYLSNLCLYFFWVFTGESKALAWIFSFHHKIGVKSLFLSGSSSKWGLGETTPNAKGVSSENRKLEKQTTVVQGGRR
jgi:hypothetical protein